MICLHSSAGEDSEAVECKLSVNQVELQLTSDSLLQEHGGALHFGTNCWTSPNHHAYMAITVQYETDGVVNEWLLDIIEVGTRHTGERLVIEFEKVLDNFGIANKVNIRLKDKYSKTRDLLPYLDPHNNM